MGIVAKTLHNKMLSAFPELKLEIFKGDEELPYMMMTDLAVWIAERHSADLTPSLIARIVDFAKWCEDQPRGVDADDDLLTILWVGFYEELFGSEAGRELLPRLIERDDFEYNAKSLRQNVGTENYNKARKRFY